MFINKNNSDIGKVLRRIVNNFGNNPKSFGDKLALNKLEIGNDDIELL
jgi:hypothetical protein